MTTPARAEAAAALLTALRDVAEANDRLQVAAAWVLEAFGDQFDAETVRMLRVPGGPDRPGRPPVPTPARSEHVTDQSWAPADLPPIRHSDESEAIGPHPFIVVASGHDSCQDCGLPLGNHIHDKEANR